MKKFKEILKSAIGDYQIKDKCALLFSGGTDSLTIFWALKELGIDFKCYTFGLKDIRSIDIEVSKLACDFYDIEHEIIEAESKGIVLRDELEEVISIIKSYRKTHVEVMWGYFYLIKNIKEKFILSGLQADTLYGSSKSMSIKYSKSPSEFRVAREKAIKNNDQEGYAQAILLSKFYNKILYAPYTHPKVRKFILKYSWRELNSPKQKKPARVGFSKYFHQIPIYRKNDNMQCGSGIREYLSELLWDKEVNKGSHTKVTRLYKEISKESLNER